MNYLTTLSSRHSSYWFGVDMRPNAVHAKIITVTHLHTLFDSAPAISLILWEKERRRKWQNKRRKFDQKMRRNSCRKHFEYFRLMIKLWYNVWRRVYGTSERWISNCVQQSQIGCRHNCLELKSCLAGVLPQRYENWVLALSTNIHSIVINIRAID